MNYKGPGIYRHYKGGLYRAIGVAQHESTGAQMVIYHSYSANHELDRFRTGIDFVARPLDSKDGLDAWNERVGTSKDSGGLFTKHVPRFEKA